MASEKSTLAPSDFKDEKVKSSSASVNSVSTTETLVDNAHFKPNRSLFIDAKGIRLIRLPVNSSETEIPIFSSDGTLAYVSTRERKCSSSAVLSSPKGGDLVSTTYFFGPGRNPVIQQLDQSPDSKASGPVSVTGKWTSRSTTFVMPDGKTFEWSYVRSKQEDGKTRTLLVLHQQNDGSGASATSGRRIAQLVRSAETRPQGSSKHHAGNGGELVLDEDSVEWLDEPMIVATCILMLKKEIDRRRLLQMAVLAGGAGGGS
ncbi:hypothetical protein FQN54_001409 [Arachnomyces sp. PD_36]|nr:hypothetical protein FQN54_001409 [Arachnomyces sp. PD_36]